jgi:hypothetical protein
MTMEEAVTKRLKKLTVAHGTKNGMGPPVSLGNKNDVDLVILPRAEKTLRKIIANPDSPDLIDGVKIEPLQVHPDDRGFFMELARLGKGLATQMIPEGQRPIQVSFTLTYPRTIKAIHYHAEHTGVEPIELLYFTVHHYRITDPLQRTCGRLRLGNSAQMNPCGS